MPGKLADLVAFAKEMEGIIGRVAGAKPSVAGCFGGNANEIAWISQAESIAAMEETLAKLTADPEYRAALGKAAQIVVPGMTKDQIWRHI